MCESIRAFYFRIFLLEFSSGLGRPQHSILAKDKNLFSDNNSLQKRLRRKMSQNSPSWWFRKISQHGAHDVTNHRTNETPNGASTSHPQPRRHREKSHPQEGGELIDRENPLASSTEYVSKEDLGRATWLLLHSIASQYPDEPTEREKRDAKNLVNAITNLYPCKECQVHFKTVIEKYPPEVADSVSFQEWMCKVHNAVNEKLGKEIFDCAKVDERWGGVECFGEDGSSEGGCSFEDAPRRSRRVR